MERFVFFGGKGGVGKTTVSCAYGLKCARGGLETLVVSTDPAHSTSDLFEQSFDDEPRPVDGEGGLHAMELDPDEEVERHLQEIRGRMADHVSPAVVNEIDRQVELAHRTPGAYEAALFDRVIDVMREADDFDRVVFDTAPTGGTLRLLSLPTFLGEWIDRLVEKRAESLDLFEKAAIGEKSARKRLADDPIIAHLQERRDEFEFAGRTLREEAAFYLVLNPDELSLNETRRAVADMADHDLAVRGLVLNKVTPAPDDDEDGPGARYLRERVAVERDRIETVREEFDQPVVGLIESRVSEVKGDLLGALAEELDIEVAEKATT